MKDIYMSIPMKKLNLCIWLLGKAFLACVLMVAQNPMTVVQAAESPIVVVWDSTQPFADKVDVETRT